MTENQTHDLDLRAELEVANILNEQKEAENAQSLFTAIVTGATDRITTKHDPWCDCGICQYCRGDEDKFGNPTDRSVIEINRLRQSMKMIAMCRCGHEKADHKQMFNDGRPTSKFPCHGYGCVCGKFEEIDWEESDTNHQEFMDYQRSIRQ